MRDAFGGVSPGEKLDAQDALAFEVFTLLQRLPWEVIKDLHGLHLTERDAEALLVRLQWLTRWQQERRQLAQGSTTSQRPPS